MNYTPNHHLPQWVPSDRVRMEDFNQMSKDIESGLDQAMQAASAAQSAASAAFSPSNMPYVIGSYTGCDRGGQNQTIELPFKPSLVIVSGILDNTDGSSTENIHYIAVSRNETNIRRRLQLINNGFIVYAAGNYDRQTPNLNVNGRHYDYIAFR